MTQNSYVLAEAMTVVKRNVAAVALHHMRMTVQWDDGQGVCTMANQSFPIVMEEVTDPKALSQAQQQDARFARNFAWFQAHATEIFTSYRGKCICVAGEELFVADTPEQALALATAAHPEDDGSFLRYIPREKIDRIYAN